MSRTAFRSSLFYFAVVFGVAMFAVPAYLVIACEGLAPIPCQVCYSSLAQRRILHCDRLTEHELRDVQIVRGAHGPWLRLRTEVSESALHELMQRCGPLSLSRSSIRRSVSPSGAGSFLVVLEGAVVIAPL